MSENPVEAAPARVAWILGAGYLGSALHGLLTAEGWAVWRVDRDPARADAGFDATDAQRWASCNLPRPDVLFFCLSTRGGDAAAYARLYPRVVRAAADRCPGARLVFCSSTSVYGIEDGSAVDESTPCRPLREHGLALLEAERAVRETGGIVVRLSALYGPGRCRAVRGYCLGEDCLSGDWDRWVNFIHRDDAAGALFVAAKDAPPGSIWNASDAMPMRKGQLFSLLWESTGLPFPTQKSPRARRRATNQRVDAAALRSLGWTPTYPTFASALSEVLASFAGDDGEG